jgi:dynein assembly factor 2
MFEEYAKEISDPKNRAENLAYLQQLEAENQVPNGMKLVVPTPGFCLKSMAGQVKVFVNFCFSDEIDNASAEKADGGSSWQVPFIMPPQCRYDLDRDQQRVTVFDVVFGPQTIARAELQDSFKRMVIEVGLDGVDKNGKLETKLSRDFKLMQNVKARAAPIPALSIRSDSTAASQSKSNKNSKSAVPASSTLNALASKNVAPVAPSAPPAPAKVPSTVTSNRTSSAKPAASTTSPKVEKSVEKTIENTLETPKHSIVHRGEFSLQNFTVDRTEGLGARRPRELLVHIELPLLSTIASVELDVSDRDVRVHAPGVYAPLKIALPYRVDDAAAGAKFDKTSRRLTITLPLAALTAEEIASFKASIAPLSAPVEADPVVPESKPEPVAAVAATLNAASVSAVNDTKSSSAKQVPASTTASDKPSTPHFSMRQTPTLVTLLFKVTGVEPKSIRLNVTSKTVRPLFNSDLHLCFLDSTF